MCVRERFIFHAYTRWGKNNRHAQQDAVTDIRLENDLLQHFGVVEIAVECQQTFLAHDTGHLFVSAPSSTNDLVSFFRELKMLV